VVGLGVVGIEGDGALGFGIGVGAIPVAEEIKSGQGIVSLRKRIVELDGFVGGRFPLGSRFLGIEFSADRAGSVVVGETAPGGVVVLVLPVLHPRSCKKVSSAMAKPALRR
jgi:hypothetical protein